MNFQKLKKAILDIGLNKVVDYLENGYYDDYDDDDYENEDEEDESEKSEEKRKKKYDETIKKIEDLNLVLVHESGGYSGGGEEAERIFFHKDEKEGRIYVRINGYYSSYEGTEWNHDNIERVQPETRSVTIYNPYKK